MTNQRKQKMSGLWATDKPEFLERLGRLAGRTTFRDLSGSRGVKENPLPDEHAIAAALSFARIDQDDFGPDVAYCWALGSDAYRNKVTRQLAIALRSHQTRSMAAHRLLAAEAAWTAMVHNRRASVNLPTDVRPVDFDRLLLAAIAELYDAAWGTLRRAEAKYRAAA
jgi:hypothetical protein